MEKLSKKIDLAGKRFGRLLVLCDTGRRLGTAVVWKCQCDCGKIVEVQARNLLHCGTISCGCNRKEKANVNLAGDTALKLGQVEHTNASKLVSTKPQKNNKIGFRGVSWHKNNHGSGAWIAVIYFQRKRYRLGFFATPQAASEAYQEAKERIHGDFLTWYNKTYKRKQKKNEKGR